MAEPGLTFQEKLERCKEAALTAALRNPVVFHREALHPPPVTAASIGSNQQGPEGYLASTESVQIENERSLASVSLQPTVPRYSSLTSARKRKHADDAETDGNDDRFHGDQDHNMDRATSHVGNIAHAPLNSDNGPSERRKKTAKKKDVSIEKVETKLTADTSEWYQQINGRAKPDRSNLDTLKYILTLSRECMTEAARGEDVTIQLNTLRTRLHQMRFYGFLSGVLIKRSKLLDNGGLSRIFDNNDGLFPWDIKADALVLQERWLAGKIDPDLLEGVRLQRKKKQGGNETVAWSLDPAYPKTPCDYIGQGELHNGQWFPLKICALRDGAHGEIEAGIHGRAGIGAYSIVLSSGGYQDKDDGERIKYCGTAGSWGTPSAATNLLMLTLQNGHPVRVFRTAAMKARDSIYQPAKGIRYDGLYDLEGFTLLRQDIEMHQFSLCRQAGQDPIRYQGVEKRPTEEELKAYRETRELSGFTA